MTDEKLSNYFDRIVLINLKRRPDRRAGFEKQLTAMGWPFAPITVFDAIEGDKVGVPDGWKSGGGAYGCMQSHRQVVEQAIMDDVETLLVFEDDALFRKDFIADFTKFLSEVPADWEGMWIGGQHHTTFYDGKGTAAGGQKSLVSPRVLKVTNVQRTHCYALKGREIMRDLYRMWQVTDVHCDWVLSRVQQTHKVYSPVEFLVCQDASKSDINGANNPVKCWSDTPANSTVVHLKCPKDVMSILRSNNFHVGLDHNSDDIDVTLALAMQEDGRKERRSHINKYLEHVVWEAAQTGEQVATVWCPNLPDDVVRRAVKARGDTLVVIEAKTLPEAVVLARAAGLRQADAIKLDEQDSASKVFWLQGDREEAEALRKDGYHSGHWRSDGGFCRGLDDIFKGDYTHEQKVKKLRDEWLPVIRTEKSYIRNGKVMIWHPEADEEVIREAVGSDLVVMRELVTA